MKIKRFAPRVRTVGISTCRRMLLEAQPARVALVWNIQFDEQRRDIKNGDTYPSREHIVHTTTVERIYALYIGLFASSGIKKGSSWCTEAVRRLYSVAIDVTYVERDSEGRSEVRHARYPLADDAPAFERRRR